MKIGVNSRIYQSSNSGIQYSIKMLYKSLISSDKNNEYIFFQTSDNKRIGKTRILNLKVFPFSSALFDLFLINILLKREKLDIFHGPSNILPFFKLKKVKYLLTVHDLSSILFKKNHSHLFNLFFFWGIWKSLSNADIIVTPSQSTKKDIINIYKIPEEKIKVVYWGVNKFYFNKSKIKRIVNDKYFFSLTTHSKRKNIMTILKVFAANKHLKKFKYVIAGLVSVNQLVNLRKEIERLRLTGRVLILGYVTEKQLKNLYENAEFFIYPSFYEGFGFPVLEAMICKCPVITSNNSSLVEITPNDDWLIDPYDIENISVKIDRLLSLAKKERLKLVNNNYDFAKNFTWEKTAKKYLNIFKVV